MYCYHEEEKTRRGAQARRGLYYSSRGPSTLPLNFPPSLEVQIFGIAKSPATRAAQRFFAERRVKVHFVDLKERAASKGELQRFVQKFGMTALIDKTSRRYAELGLGAARLDDAHWMEKLMDEPLLLVMPLVRWQQKLTLGEAVAEWKVWAEAGK